MDRTLTFRDGVTIIDTRNLPMQLDAPEIRDLKSSGLEIFLEVLAAGLMLSIWGIAIYQFRLTARADPGVSERVRDEVRRH